jgi:D-alanyl-lipoteichoic acid acyltransferase DltB (MBOAT superfamily)
MPLLQVLLPLGISFYTFKSLSYSIDVFRGKIVPTYDFSNYALFVAFFPELTAGPIDQAKTLLPKYAPSGSSRVRRF